MNNIVQAIPASIYLNASKRVKDESEKNSPRKNSGTNSLNVIFNETFFTNFNQTPYISKAKAYL